MNQKEAKKNSVLVSGHDVVCDEEYARWIESLFYATRTEPRKLENVSQELYAKGE